MAFKIKKIHKNAEFENRHHKTRVFPGGKWDVSAGYRDYYITMMIFYVHRSHWIIIFPCLTSISMETLSLCLSPSSCPVRVAQRIHSHGYKFWLCWRPLSTHTHTHTHTIPSSKAWKTTSESYSSQTNAEESMSQLPGFESRRRTCITFRGGKTSSWWVHRLFFFRSYYFIHSCILALSTTNDLSDASLFIWRRVFHFALQLCIDGRGNEFRRKHLQIFEAFPVHLYYIYIQYIYNTYIYI